MGGRDKHRPKSGRYVGGFLHLFDWNAKSRKKLFSNKSDLPEESKQGKKFVDGLPTTRIHVDEDEEFSTFGAGLSARGGSDYSCASSVTDDGFGTKAPSVVARLMGLDSLPTSNEMDPFSSPFFDSLCLREAPFRGRNIDFYHNHPIVHSTHLYDKIENTTRNIQLESKSSKLPNNRPIEKFQTEILPPKSAKTIPITHHKLLSPIKSPIFVPSQDVAHIMEAAAKIIVPRPSTAPPRARISSTGSSTVPLKVREMREKLEASKKPTKVSEQLQRPIESNVSKQLRGQPMNKSWIGLGESTLYKASPSREDCSTSTKNKGKSVSLAIQAKVNVQQREGLTSSSKLVGDSEEKDDKKSTHLSRNQASAPKLSSRKPLNQSNLSVLRQNNQKQNCPSSHRERSGLKGSLSSSTSKKSISEDTSINSQPKTVARTSSRKSSLSARDNDKGVPRKKRSIEGNLHFNKNQSTEKMLLASKNEKPSHSNALCDKQFTWIEESRRKGLDVVSFTFTAPITRSNSGFEKGVRENESKIVGNSDSKRLSSPGLIKGDALSKLLEQKLKEVASNLESYDATFVKPGLAQQTVGPGSAESVAGKNKEKLSKHEKLLLDMNSQNYSGLLTKEDRQFQRTINFQANGDKDDAHKWNDHHLPSPVSILEPSVPTDSCSSESIASSITEESRLYSSIQAQEVIGSHSLHNTEISDSASSTSSQLTTNKEISVKSTAWELNYIKDILCNIELMFKDYVGGRTREILNPHLFDQMERRGVGENELKLERKILFNCVGECLDLKCQSFACGGFDMWIKGITTLKRKERLAEEIYEEIRVWRKLGNCMVDELVDKDMSSKYGRWLNFEVDEFVLGVEIEGQILDSLVGEMVFDIFSK